MTGKASDQEAADGDKMLPAGRGGNYSSVVHQSPATCLEINAGK